MINFPDNLPKTQKVQILGIQSVTTTSHKLCVCIFIFFWWITFSRMYLQLPPPPMNLCMNKSLIILESHYHCLSQTSINHDQFNEQKRLIESFVYSEQTQPFKHLFHHHNSLKINWSLKQSSRFSYFFLFQNIQKMWRDDACSTCKLCSFEYSDQCNVKFFLARIWKHFTSWLTTSGIDSNHSMIPVLHCV